jgi:transcriptional regulator with XRE-family HTH domain
LPLLAGRDLGGFICGIPNLLRIERLFDIIDNRTFGLQESDSIMMENRKGRQGVADNGRNEDVDPEVGSLLCDRVRELRKKKGWTLEQLSAACGVSRSMLSQIERNQANPTLGVAYRIAQAFGMSLGSLVDAPSATPTIDIIRVNDRTYHYRNDQSSRIRTLSPLHLEKDVEFYEVLLRPGGSLKSAPHFGGTREFLTVQHGSIRLVSGDDSAELHRGDSAHYPADVVHTIENVGKGDALLFLVDIYRET